MGRGASIHQLKPFKPVAFGVQAPVFRAKYRARFLQLADIFLSSGMVPAYTAAAFIKKFARLALTAPPAGALPLPSLLCLLSCFDAVTSTKSTHRRDYALQPKPL